MPASPVRGLRDSLQLLFKAGAVHPMARPWTARTSRNSATPMPVREAQSTRVCLQRGFLSPQDAAELIRRFDTLGIQPCANVYETDFDAEGRTIHEVRYVQEAGRFRLLFPRLRKAILAFARRANVRQGWGLDLSTVSVRVAEYHRYLVGGGLPARDHYDKGSLVTVGVILLPAARGGLFQAVEPSRAGRGGVGSKAYSMQVGDAVAFVSHKYHRVSAVAEGERKVLIVELWGGEERMCAHRCELFHGRCDFDPNATSTDLHAALGTDNIISATMLNLKSQTLLGHRGHAKSVLALHSPDEHHLGRRAVFDFMEC